MEEEDACLVSKQNTKATAWSRLSSLRSLLKNELLLTPLFFFPALPLFCLELPAENRVFVITQAVGEL